uniref:Uncharacterized protein n=1 Tax=Manihot esculenta TaxID=3983 RepID=A0A2C9UL44_MANES
MKSEIRKSPWLFIELREIFGRQNHGFLKCFIWVIEIEYQRVMNLLGFYFFDDIGRVESYNGRFPKFQL